MGLVIVDLVAAGLTVRERAIAELILEARSNLDIAQALGISEDLVKGSLRRLCRRALIDDPSRVQLALMLLGIPRRAEKNHLRVRREVLRGFRRPGRPRLSAAES